MGDVKRKQYVLSFINVITDSDYMKQLGKRIKSARLLIGFTQERLAEKVGVSRAAISRWELGEIEPKIENLVSLTFALNVSADYLLGIECKNKKWELDLSDEGYFALRKFICEVKKTKKV